MKQKGIEVISVSSGMDQNIFQTGTESFLWNIKLCDFRGPEGINFKNYGVLGPPTIFFIDKKGIITGRYAKLEESKFIIKVYIQ